MPDASFAIRPSQDTFLRVFRVLDPKQFETVFRRWVGGIVGALDGVLAVDGKTLRRSADGDAPPVHMVSAFSTELGLVLGQEKGLASSHNPCIHCLCVSVHPAAFLLRHVS